MRKQALDPGKQRIADRSSHTAGQRAFRAFKDAAHLTRVVLTLGHGGPQRCGQRGGLLRQLHATLLPQLGFDPVALNRIEASPTTLSYTSYLLATVYGAGFAEGLAAVLPCYWIYARVGAALLEKGSPDPRYQRWIDTYGGAEFTATVSEVLALADGVGAGISAAEHARARNHFAITSRYEWMFWDAAWRKEQWPLMITTGDGRVSDSPAAG